MYVYPACFYREDDGYSVIFPNLHYLSTCGATLEESMSAAVDCLAGYLHTLKLDGEEIPAPSPLSDVNPEALARELDPDSPVSECFANLISVDVEEYARTHFSRSVKKTLSIPAWMDDAAKRRGVNFSRVLQDALLKIIEER